MRRRADACDIVPVGILDGSDARLVAGSTFSTHTIPPPTAVAGSSYVVSGLELVRNDANAAAARPRGLGRRLQHAYRRYGARSAVSRAQRLPMASDLSPSLSTAVTAVLILLFRPACRVGTSKPRLPRLGIVRSTTATGPGAPERSR